MIYKLINLCSMFYSFPCALLLWQASLFCACNGFFVRYLTLRSQTVNSEEGKTNNELNETKTNKIKLLTHQLIDPDKMTDAF